MTTEERLSRLEGAYEQVDQRLGDLTRAVESVRTEMHEQNAALRQEMHEQNAALRQEMHEQNAALLQEMSGMRSDLLLEMGRQNQALREAIDRQGADLRDYINSRVNNVYLFAGGAWITSVGITIGLFLQA